MRNRNINDKSNNKCLVTDLQRKQLEISKQRNKQGLKTSYAPLNNMHVIEKHETVKLRSKQIVQIIYIEFTTTTKYPVIN